MLKEHSELLEAISKWQRGIDDLAHTEGVDAHIPVIVRLNQAAQFIAGLCHQYRCDGPRFLEGHAVLIRHLEAAAQVVRTHPYFQSTPIRMVATPDFLPTLVKLNAAENRAISEACRITQTLHSACLAYKSDVVSTTTQDLARPPVPKYVFRRTGDMWEVQFDGEAGHFTDTQGLGYIARLLGRPGKQVAATDLHGIDPSRVVEFNPDQAIDRSARNEYERRLEDLDELIKQATESGSLARVDELQHERDGIARQIETDTGIGGKSRALGTTGPKKSAQVAVGKAIKTTITTIAETMPRLTEHLKASIRTGADCTYNPSTPTDWRLD